MTQGHTSRRRVLGAVAALPVAGYFSGTVSAETSTSCSDDINPILESSGDWNDVRLRSPTVYQPHINAPWRLLFEATGSDGSQGIYAARSNDLRHWTVETKEPILAPRSDEDWVTGATVLRYNGQLHVWFGARDGSSYEWTIHHASGPSVLELERDANPMLTPGAEHWMCEHVRNPDVLYHRGQLYLYYMGHDGTDWQIGIVTSEDGIEWTRVTDNPVLDGGSTFDESDVANPGIVSYRGRIYCFYEGLADKNPPAKIGVASGLDPANLSRWTTEPVLSPGDGWDGYQVFDAEVLVVDGQTVLLFYVGMDEPGGQQAIGVKRYELSS